jgi:SAM-dependent methyltransferase
MPVKNTDQNKAMDFFAKAVIELYEKKKVDFYFEFGDGIREDHNLSRYLRTKFEELSQTEQKLISLCSGNILDVGSATGYYLPFMKEKGSILGLELSKDLVKFGNQHFSKDLVCGDFFNYNFTSKFDTITLLENNLGICKTEEGLFKMIEIFDQILEPTGQILIITRKYNRSFSNSYKNIVTLTPYLNGQKGGSFDWITFDEEYLKDIFLKKGFKVEEIYSEGGDLLLKASRLITN